MNRLLMLFDLLYLKHKNEITLELEKQTKQKPYQKV